VRPYVEKNPQKRAGGVAQGIGPEFKPQYCKINNNNFLSVMFIAVIVS
jgi:hypothetical protein